MSYILEALKKLEQKRQREGLRHPLTVPADTAPERKKQQPFWLYALLAALLLNAGVMMWWVGPRLGQRPAQVQAPAAPEGTPATSPSPEQTRGERQSAAEKEPLQTRGADASTVAVTDKQAREAPRPAPEPSPAPAAASPKPQARTETRSIAAGKTLTLGELPPSLRSSLPELRMSAHYYTAEPKSRFIRIDDRTIREGESNDSGLKLEEVTPEGAVFSYQGYRFQVGVQETR